MGGKAHGSIILQQSCMGWRHKSETLCMQACYEVTLHRHGHTWFVYKGSRGRSHHQSRWKINTAAELHLVTTYGSPLTSQRTMTEICMSKQTKGNRGWWWSHDWLRPRCQRHLGLCHRPLPLFVALLRQISHAP